VVWTTDTCVTRDNEPPAYVAENGSLGGVAGTGAARHCAVSWGIGTPAATFGASLDAR
jgi:hypothetical protein